MRTALPIAGILALAVIGVLMVRFFGFFAPQGNIVKHEAGAGERTYLNQGLMTNTALHSIPLDQVLDGGPGKDGIPALVDPAFTDLARTDPSIEKSDGILVSAGGETKFYPYNILVWHEVVNDTVGGVPLVVTFCPLCGSAIVFDARIGGKKETFGVSGKLYNSNLLMYDKSTESLWSQIEGEVVVGDRMGQKLTLYPSQVVSFARVEAAHPDARVLSTATGYSRDYSFYPYGDYNTSATLYFPVAIEDTRLPAKEIMRIVNYGGHSIAFVVRDLTKAGRAEVAVGTTTLSARVEDGEIVVRAKGGAPLAGYTAMWFSWAVYHQQDGIVWTAHSL